MLYYYFSICFSILFTGAEFVFSIYDCDGKKNIDAYDIGNALRALNLNPTMELIEKMGGTTKRGQKKFKFEEFLPIFSQVSQHQKSMKSILNITNTQISPSGKKRKGSRLLRRFPWMSKVVRQRRKRNNDVGWTPALLTRSW